MRRAAVALALGMGAAHAAEAPLVDAAGLVPGLVVEMRYAGTDNFVGRRVDGYEAPRCLLTRAAALALGRAQADLAVAGYGLKVFDCYRPARAVADFAAWARDPADTRTKRAFYPDVDKRDLFRLGYVAARSAHSRGSTVDLTLVRHGAGAAPEAEGPRDVDMGTPFDRFGPEAAFGWPGATPAQRAARGRLRAAMARAGFAPYAREWWHFTLNGEPYPATHFDVPVR